MTEKSLIKKNKLTVERIFEHNGTPKRDTINILLKKTVIDDVDNGLKYSKIKEKYGFKHISNIRTSLLCTKVYKTEASILCNFDFVNYFLITLDSLQNRELTVFDYTVFKEKPQNG